MRDCKKISTNKVAVFFAIVSSFRTCLENQSILILELTKTNINLKLRGKPIKFDRFMLHEAMRSMALSGWPKCEMGDSITLFFVLNAKYSSSRAALF